MSRYEEPFEITLTQSQAGRLGDHGRYRDATQLLVRVQGDRVVASWPPRSGFDSPPRFAGSVRTGAGAVIVAGVIRESFTNTIWSRAPRCVAVLMVLLALLGAVLLVTNGVHYGLAPLLIGVVGGLLFALVWRGLGAIRKPNFDRDAARLRAGLTQYLTTGAR